MALASVGVALGLFGALWLTRLLQQLLFEVAPTDPLTYVGVAWCSAWPRWWPAMFRRAVRPGWSPSSPCAWNNR